MYAGLLYLPPFCVLYIDCICSPNGDGHPKLKTFAEHGIAGSQTNIPASSVSHHTTGSNIVATQGGVKDKPATTVIESETDEFDGETSLHAHSIAARDLLFQALGSDAHVRDQPKMVAALSALRQIVETDKTESSRKPQALVDMGRTRSAIYDLKLPPTDGILNILHMSRERKTFTFSPPMGFVTRDEFNEFCKTVFFRTDDYPVSTAVIVHGTLENLLHEFEWTEDDPGMRQKYKDWSELCRYNLEFSISSLGILLPVNMESAQALLMAAAYCMEKAQVSVCKKLVLHGCMTVHSLGWHRASSMKNDSKALQQQKRVIFWMLYVIDKNLTLRLGQASLIQDYDIDLPLPDIEPTDSSKTPITFGRINRWVAAAKIMDSIYQKLYSPGALRQPDSMRFLAVQELLQQVETIRPEAFEKSDMTQLIEDPDFIYASYMHNANLLVFKSDEIVYNALMCIIYRATPKSAQSVYDSGPKCVQYARAALDCHEKCTVAFKGQPELWAAYLHWTVLNTPFIPFTTLFSHVITNHDRADLDRLHKFAESMSGCPTSEAAYKVSRVASVFVTVATVYIESHNQQAQAPDGKTSNVAATHAQDCGDSSNNIQTLTNPAPASAPFNSFLDALGFAEDPLQYTNEASLDSWLTGNQHIMGLLENDLSYLDADELMF